MYFMSGAPMRYIGALLLLGVLGVSILIAVTPYRLERITGFLNPEFDIQGINYQGDQARTAIGSGRLFGMGYGQATAKTGYLPAVIDDSVFAVIGQELGFAGAGVIVVFFAMFTLRMFSLARRAPDRFAALLLIGFGSIIAIQSSIHIGVTSGFFPVTGVPLPFVSYGGTALAVFLTMSGIAINISKHT
jgi:cell division protein FtsW